MLQPPSMGDTAYELCQGQRLSVFTRRCPDPRTSIHKASTKGKAGRKSRARSGQVFSANVGQFVLAATALSGVSDLPSSSAIGVHGGAVVVVDIVLCPVFV